MSMLAERKKKTKWIINPTKKPLWASGSSGIKFGKEIMEKMGWSAGKGLGANEQGIQEPIKVSYKNDTKGMGFKGNDDQWIEHQDDFNILLDKLKADSSVKYNSEGEKNEVWSSLEEKSKKSKARLHYQKFLRGKDLSRYSDNDLACILGTTKLLKKKLSSAEKIETKSKNSSNIETSFGVTTINSGSLSDYFKKKWIFDKKVLEEVNKTDECFRKSLPTKKYDLLENFDVEDENKTLEKRHSVLKAEEKLNFDKSELCESKNCEETVTKKAEGELKSKKKKYSHEGIVENEPQQKNKNYLDIKQELLVENDNDYSNSVKKRKKSFENNENLPMGNANLESCDKKRMKRKENKDTEDKGLSSVQSEPSHSFITENLSLEVEFSKKKKSKKDKKEKKYNEEEHDTKYPINSNSESVALGFEKKSKKNRKEKLENSEAKNTQHSNHQNSEASELKLETKSYKIKHKKARKIESEDCKNVEEFSDNLSLRCCGQSHDVTEFSFESELSKKKKKRPRNDENIKSTFSETVTHNKNGDSIEINLEDDLNKKKKKKDKKEELKNLHCNTEIVGEAVESGPKVESSKKNNIELKKKSKLNNEVKNKKETNQKSLGDALNEKSEASGIQKHKFDFLNDKKIDKFYPGEHRNGRVQRLLCYVNFSEFKGANIGSVTGYGYLLKCGNNTSHQ